MAQGAVQAVKQEAASFTSDAKDKASEKVDEKLETATQTLSDFANAVRRAGDELGQSDQSMAAQFIRQASDGLESFARSVADKRPEELIDAVRDFGRRNPTAFIAGSVLAGVALGRLLRSSESHGEPKRNPLEETSFSAPGGAPPTYELADLDAVGANMTATRTGADAAAETDFALNQPDRHGSRS